MSAHGRRWPIVVGGVAIDAQCKAGARIELDMYTGIGHFDIRPVAPPHILDWFAERFAGDPVSCGLRDKDRAGGLVNVLIVTWDGGGNRQPFEVVVDALVARGDTVRVISNEVHRDLYASLGASFVSLDVADKDPATRSDLETQIGRVREVMFSPLTSRTVLQNVEDADVGLVDVVMLSAQAACERAQLPFVSMHHTLSGASWGGTRRALHESFLPNVNEMRESLGLAPLAAYGDVHLAAAGHIVPTAAALDAVAPVAGRPDLRRPAPTSRPRARAVGSARSVRARVVLDDVADAGWLAAAARSMRWRRSTSPSSSRPGRRSRRPSSPRARTRSSSSNCRIAPSSIVSRSSSRTPAMARCSPASPQVCPSFAYPRDAISTTSRAESRRTGTGIVVNADDVGEQLLDGVRSVLERSSLPSCGDCR